MIREKSKPPNWDKLYYKILKLHILLPAASTSPHTSSAHATQVNEHASAIRWAHHKFRSLSTPDHDLIVFKCTKEIFSMLCLLLCTHHGRQRRHMSRVFMPSQLPHPGLAEPTPWMSLHVSALGVQGLCVSSTCDYNKLCFPASLCPLFWLHPTDHHMKEDRTRVQRIKRTERGKKTKSRKSFDGIPHSPPPPPASCPSGLNLWRTVYP